MMPPVSSEAAAEDLRAQAASCRHLAARATSAGSAALKAVAEYFDSNASRIEPLGTRR